MLEIAYYNSLGIEADYTDRLLLEVIYFDMAAIKVVDRINGSYDLSEMTAHQLFLATNQLFEQVADELSRK